jgi:hypothetical protein
MPRLAVLTLVVTIGAALACGGGGSSSGDGGGVGERLFQEGIEKAIEANNPGSDVELGANGFSVKKDDGSAMQIGGNVALPADFPKDVPIYAGGKLVAAVTSPSTAGGGNDFMISYETPDSPKQVMDWYKAQMSGYTVAAEMNYEGTSSLVLSNDGGKTNISITTSQGSTASTSGSTVMLGVSHGS